MGGMPFLHPMFLHDDPSRNVSDQLIGSVNKCLQTNKPNACQKHKYLYERGGRGVKLKVLLLFIINYVENVL